MSDKEVPEEEKIEEPTVEELKEPTMEDLEAQIKEYQNKYLGALAETENAKKRMQKEKVDSMQYAIDNILGDLLLPLDNFEKALGFKEQMSEEVRNWSMGFEMILSQLQEGLANNGIVPFNSVGERFDPTLHEAVEIEEIEEGEENMIVEEFIRGYKSKERILRPAKVKVTKIKIGEKEDE
ncbi:MAG: nucleotide exchange factor GrpE [Candidatus Algichlamydia australiensis]|nr:nucleotide exchange factor GrpE [Chlamydiales bacterium]